MVDLYRVILSKTAWGTLLGGALWLSYRVATLGVNNVFSQEYGAVDAAPLTEEVAIEFSRRALVEAGHDVSQLAPVEYWSKYPDGHAERVFARNASNPNQGYVLWGRRPGGAISSGATSSFKVRVHRDDNGIDCRVYQAK